MEPKKKSEVYKRLDIYNNKLKQKKKLIYSNKIMTFQDTESWQTKSDNTESRNNTNQADKQIRRFVLRIIARQ